MNLIILQSSAPAVTNFVFLFAIMAVMYLFFIRPQNRRQKEQAAFSSELNKGDEVVTASGIIGKINKIEGNVIQLQIDQKTFVKMLSSAISREMTVNYHKSGEEEKK
mgnify:CR=1 FL=1